MCKSPRPAGLGTRFSAWLIDGVFVLFVTIALFFTVAFLMSAAGIAMEQMLDRFDPEDNINPQQIEAYVAGFMILIWGFGSFFYFTLSELLWRGQTFGKKKMKVRVVKANGFALDPGSIFLRNIFRLVDQIPIVWIVPVLSARSQRLGDMVAGTGVVAEGQNDGRHPLHASHGRSPANFDSTARCSAATPTDEAVEKISTAGPQLHAAEELVNRVVVDCPPHQRNRTRP
jgi:uncharacterized RDD family membrane protein YckC